MHWSRDICVFGMGKRKTAKKARLSRSWTPGGLALNKYSSGAVCTTHHLGYTPRHSVCAQNRSRIMHNLSFTMLFHMRRRPKPHHAPLGLHHAISSAHQTKTEPCTAWFHQAISFAHKTDAVSHPHSHSPPQLTPSDGMPDPAAYRTRHALLRTTHRPGACRA